MWSLVPNFINGVCGLVPKFFRFHWRSFYFQCYCGWSMNHIKWLIYPFILLFHFPLLQQLKKVIKKIKIKMFHPLKNVQPTLYLSHTPSFSCSATTTQSCPMIAFALLAFVDLDNQQFLKPKPQPQHPHLRNGLEIQCVIIGKNMWVFVGQTITNHTVIGLILYCSMFQTQLILFYSYMHTSYPNFHEKLIIVKEQKTIC